MALHGKLRVYAFGVVGFKLPEGTTDTDVADAMIEAADAITRLEQEATDLHEAAAEAQRLYLVADREALDAKREAARLQGEVEALREALSIFLGADDQFQVAVGGNPIAIGQMLDKVSALLSKLEGK